MFYANFVLSKKGPLAKVWLAAHWDRKLTKAHVFETDVEKTVDNIISPKVKMALRTSGHLLLGVVRIYSRKQKYLIQDLGEACAKIKMAFRPGVVDMPSDGVIACADTITLPEIFHDFETAVADLNTVDMEDQMVLHRRRAEEITLKDNFVGSGSGGMFALEDDFHSMENEFGGMLEDIEIPRRSLGLEKSTVSDLSQISLPNVEQSKDNLMDVDQPPRRGSDTGGFGDGFGDFGNMGLQDDILNMPDLNEINLDQPLENMEVEGSVLPVVPEAEGDVTAGDKDRPLIPPNDTIVEGDVFVLEPLDVSVRARQKRKRKLIVDARKELTGEMIRAQLRDPSDTLQSKLVPPPEKKALLWKEFGVSDYLLSNPTLGFLSSEIAGLVSTHLEKIIDVDDIQIDTTLPELEAEVPRLGVADEEAVAPPKSPSIPVTDVNEDLRGDIDLPLINDPGNDLIDNMDLEGEIPPEKVIPDMPDLDEEVNEEGGAGAANQSNKLEEGEVDKAAQRRWSKRAGQMLGLLEKGFKNNDSLEFSILTKRCSRKQAASRFYTCLLLGKEGAIRFEQAEPYSAINITPGPLFNQSLQ